MARTKQDIIDEFSSYIVGNGNNGNGWYVGITKDRDERLFNFHNVKENGGVWISWEAPSTEIAREIEKYFLDRGADGGTGGGDDDSNIVYAYKITSYTRQR